MREMTRRIGSMLTQGLDGQMTIASADWIASRAPAAGSAEFDSVKPKASHARLTASVDEIFLEWQIALIRFDNGPHGLVAHRQDGVTDSPCLAEITRDLRKGLSLFQPPRPFDMSRHVLVAQAEPIWPAQFFDVCNRLPRFVHASPAVSGFASPASV